MTKLTLVHTLVYYIEQKKYSQIEANDQSGDHFTWSTHSDHSLRDHCPLTKIKYPKPNKTKYPKDQSQNFKVK